MRRFATVEHAIVPNDPDPAEPRVLGKLGRQLDTAKRTVDEAGRRTRAVTKRLKDVETLDGVETPALIDLVSGDVDEDDSIEAAEQVEQ